jgi:hypothetical protein
MYVCRTILGFCSNAPLVVACDGGVFFVGPSPQRVDTKQSTYLKSAKFYSIQFVCVFHVKQIGDIVLKNYVQ